MRSLTLNEVENVNGALSQGETVATNLAIVAIGVACIGAALTPPGWFVGGMMLISALSVGTMDS